MSRSDQEVSVRRRASIGLFPDPATLALPIYREFVDMLFGMRLPVLGLGAVYVAICVIASYTLGQTIFAILAILGALTTWARVAAIGAYQRAPPAEGMEDVRCWERRYAIGNYISAVLLAALNVAALSTPYPALHLVTVSLLFSYGAGWISRTSVRPKICVISLLLATGPTVAALAFQAFAPHPDALHTEMFLVEAALVAMIEGLSLHTVGHLYRSAVEHHTARHDFAQLAKYDALTGLANRLLLRERFQASIDAAERSHTRLAVHFLDLDGFKAINDQHGHPTGDALLQQVAQRLKALVGAGDTVARLGGDEFVLLQTGVLHDDEASMLARRIIWQLSLPYEIDENAVNISVSVGIAVAPHQGVELVRLLSRADAALYHAKADGKARAMFCTDDAAVHLAA
ncbi:GGDEF domain-containing protein [Sphingomonas sp. RB3P16]|uniref:GGDEF domain-containing protein n=1 Tax=Parasphingomonas frigoris TaxID=3096163 RepID=UPI002FCC2F74